MLRRSFSRTQNRTYLCRLNFCKHKGKEGFGKMSIYENGSSNSKINDSLTKPFGAFSTTGLQKFIISIVRKNPLLRSAIRTRANRLLQKIRPGVIDYELYGWNFRFFPVENSGDRKAVLTPDGFDQRECSLIVEHLAQDGLFLDIGSNIGVYSFILPRIEKTPRLSRLSQPRVFLLNYHSTCRLMD